MSSNYPLPSSFLRKTAAGAPPVENKTAYASKSQAGVAQKVKKTSKVTKAAGGAMSLLLLLALLGLIQPKSRRRSLFKSVARRRPTKKYTKAPKEAISLSVRYSKSK
jgi:hypothetical protein